MPALKNAKHERFCQEYVRDLNKTQAYIRAGYTAKSADANAHRLMGNDGVQARIAELQTKASAKLEITQEKVLSDLETARTKALEDKQFGPAIRAGELLGKHIGMWPNKIDANINLIDKLNDAEQRIVAAALAAIARDKGEDAEGATATHH